MQKNDSIKINQNITNQIQIGISWDFIDGKKIDLDATVVIINEMG